jgi:hypothetical protein
MGRSEKKEDDSSFSTHERGEREVAVPQKPFNWKTEEKYYSLVVDGYQRRT